MNNKRLVLMLTISCVISSAYSMHAMEKYDNIEVEGRGLWDKQFDIIKEIYSFLTHLTLTFAQDTPDQVNETFDQLNKLQPPRSYAYANQENDIYNFNMLCAEKNLAIIQALKDMYAQYMQPDPCLAKEIFTQAEQNLSFLYPLFGQLETLAQKEVNSVTFCSACNMRCTTDTIGFTLPCCKHVLCVQCNQKFTQDYGMWLCLNCGITGEEYLQDSQK